MFALVICIIFLLWITTRTLYKLPPPQSLSPPGFSALSGKASPPSTVTSVRAA